MRSGVGPWVYGESRDGVIIRLDAGAPTNVTSVLRAHPSDIQATLADFLMRNFRNLTIDVGNNPGVDGIRWYGNNSSILKNIRVTGTGRVGVNSGFLDQNGPNLILDTLVKGLFETGVRCAWSWGQTLSRLTVRNARKEGVYVNATAAGIEDLDTAAIEAAIDAAAAASKTVVCLRDIGGGDPNWYSVNGEVRVRGSVRLIIGLGFGRIIGGPNGKFVVDDASAPVVKFEHIQAFGGSPCVAEKACAKSSTTAWCSISMGRSFPARASAPAW